MSKFKNVEALEKSYKELEKMFTKKCKECADKDKEIATLNKNIKRICNEKSNIINFVKFTATQTYEILDQIEKGETK